MDTATSTSTSVWTFAGGASVAAFITGLFSFVKERKRDKVRESAQQWEVAFKETELGQALYKSLVSDQRAEITYLHEQLRLATDEIRSLRDQLREALKEVDALRSRVKENGNEINVQCADPAGAA